MKLSFVAILSSLLLASVPAFSQSVSVGFPPAGTTVTAGSDITVEIDRPNFQSSALEIAIVIGMEFCSDGTCSPASEVIGPVLFNGPFNPQEDPSLPRKPPHENFTVTVPDFVGPGVVQLNIFHVSLVGAIGEPFTEFPSITLNLA